MAERQPLLWDSESRAVKRPRLSLYERQIRAEIDALTAEQRVSLSAIAQADNLNFFFGDYRMWKRESYGYLRRKEFGNLQRLGEYIDTYRTLYKPFRLPTNT